MRKFTNFDDEIEHYTKPDWTVFTLTSIAAIIVIGIIFWTPDVEAIGTWISNVIN